MGRKRPQYTPRPGSARKERIDFTPSEIAMAGELHGKGMPYDRIAALLGVSPETFERRVKDTPDLHDALMKARAEMEQKVYESAFNQAISGKSPKMTMFWLSCRLGWAPAKPLGEPPTDTTFTMRYSFGEKGNG